MIIVTHNGAYHADDVFALAILKLIHPEAKIVRTRDEQIIASADIVVDVGYIYDPDKNRFDHHQPEFTDTREEGTPYSACGLVWKHFFKKLCSKDEAAMVDSRLICGIDAIDNGFPFGNNKFGTKPYGLSKIMEIFMPTFQEEKEYDVAFAEAVGLAQLILKREIAVSKASIAAKSIVRKALLEYEKEDFVVIDQYCPWKTTVIKESDKKLGVFGRSDGAWAVCTVPTEMESFDSRIDLPLAWAGLQNEDLAKVSGVKDAIFCHKARFIAAAKSKEGAIKLARLALKEAYYQ